MALDEHDLILIENTLNRTLGPMQRLIEKHEYTLYGTNGTEGICRTVGEVKKKYDKLLRIVTIVYLVSLGILLAIDRFIFQ